MELNVQQNQGTATFKNSDIYLHLLKFKSFLNKVQHFCFHWNLRQYLLLVQDKLRSHRVVRAHRRRRRSVKWNAGRIFRCPERGLTCGPPCSGSSSQVSGVAVGRHRRVWGRREVGHLLVDRPVEPVDRATDRQLHRRRGSVCARFVIISAKA